MKFVIVFLLLAVKHFVIANVWDIGYSEARNGTNERWAFHLALHVIFEGIAASGILILAGIDYVSYYLLAESFAGVTTALVERHSPIEGGFTVHVMCEFIYGTFIAIALVSILLAKK